MSNLDSGQRRPIAEVTAESECTTKRFVDTVLAGLVRQIGPRDMPAASLALRMVADAVPPEKQWAQGTPSASAARLLSSSSAAEEEGCSAAQLAACSHAMRGLASLEGLAELLVDAVVHGVARPTPARTADLGWSPVSRAMLSGGKPGLEAGRREGEERRTGGLDQEAGEEGAELQLGGGSGAGFQVLCGEKSVASAGGGGGGGGAGTFFAGESFANFSVGGGGGGGMQLFFPANLTDEPWDSERWVSWSSGGGSGCGACKPLDDGVDEGGATAACPSADLRDFGVDAEGRRVHIACGAKMDDTGAVDPALGGTYAQLWRDGVLRRCYESGRLAIIGGGGGGAGGGACCGGVPRINFGFGFRAELKPAQARRERGGSQPVEELLGTPSSCCPDLRRWNTSAPLGARRLQSVLPADTVGPSDSAASDAGFIDPFARENTGVEAPRANRRPELEEMIRQHAARLGVSVSPWVRGERCSAPAWLSASEAELEARHAAAASALGGSQTREPASAQKYIFKFNPLQGHLTDGATKCGGWGDWCCVCHTAQWRIACLPDSERSSVEWFLTEDCCESRLERNSSSPAFVVDATPVRASTVAWSPGAGWTERPRGDNASDSYGWGGDVGVERRCAASASFSSRMAAPPRPRGAEEPARAPWAADTLRWLRGDGAPGPALRSAPSAEALPTSGAARGGRVGDGVVSVASAATTAWLMTGVTLGLVGVTIFRRRHTRLGCAGDGPPYLDCGADPRESCYLELT